eukprot:8815709-Alexandrium_andersonii.AAC.1
MSDVEPAELEQNMDDVDEEMSFLLNIVDARSEEGVCARVFGRASPLRKRWTSPERSSRRAQLPERCGPRWR